VGTAFNIQTRRPKLKNITGGLSGPAIKPVALAKVFEISRKASIPVIGIGGIMDWKDVIEFMIAGASAVQIGTLNFIDPTAPGKIVQHLEDYCIKNNIQKISSLTASYILE
jgi:dihydroorotate dehydrogenase (NAD+) catalytic subunit